MAVSAGALTRRAVSDSALNNGRYARLGTATATDLIVGVTFQTLLAVSDKLRSGVFGRYVDTSNWLMFVHHGDGSGGHSWSLIKRVAGTEATILTDSFSPQGPNTTLMMAVSASGSVTVSIDGNAIQSSGIISDLSPSGALRTGGFGVYDAYTDAAAFTREYGGFFAYAPESVGACFAGRGLEFRSDGVFRQDATADVWGRVTADGFLLYAPPSGLEGRAARVCVIPTQGDLDTLPDSGTNRLSAVVNSRAGYLYSREAAA